MVQRIFIVFVFIFFIFFRFYQLEERLAFGWDQTMNAWVMKDMLVDHNFPLVGMAAKGNSGVHIGPAYYYVLAVFYAMTNLHPIAAGYCASFMSVLTGIVLFLILRRIFSNQVAVFALAITVVSFNIIFSDRLAGPVNLLPFVSAVIFYLWYEILSGNILLLPVVATVIGFSFHLHITAVYYIFISIFCFPFIVLKKIPLKVYILSVLALFVWFIPNVIANFQESNTLVVTAGNFFQSFYHGVHLRRILQLLPDAFIEFDSIFLLRQLSIIRYLIIPIFIVLVWVRETRKKASILTVLTLLWFFVPWIVLSTFSGEISNYYFVSTRIPAIMSVAYILDSLVKSKKWYFISCVIVFFIWFIWNNTYLFWRSNDKNFIKQQDRAKEYIQSGKKMEFQEGIAESYMYSYYRNFDRK